MIGGEQAGEDSLQFLGMIAHESLVVGSFTRERFFDVLSHRFLIEARFHRDVSPCEGCHGIEFHKLHVILGFSTSFCKNFIECKLLMEECWAGVEGVGTCLNGGITATWNRGFFDDSDIVATMGEKHAASEASRASSDDDDFFTHWFLEVRSGWI